MPIIIPPGKSEAVFRSLCYLALGVAGVWVLLDPPSTVEGTIGVVLTFVWGACMLSAFIGSVASLRRRYRVEYMSLPLTIAGVAIYAYTIWLQVADLSTRGPQALIVTAIAFCLAGRFTTLHRLVYSWKGGPWTGSAQ